jgi:hypothetical protein
MTESASHPNAPQRTRQQTPPPEHTLPPCVARPALGAAEGERRDGLPLLFGADVDYVEVAAEEV